MKNHWCQTCATKEVIQAAIDNRKPLIQWFTDLEADHHKQANLDHEVRQVGEAA